MSESFQQFLFELKIDEKVLSNSLKKGEQAAAKALEKMKAEIPIHADTSNIQGELNAFEKKLKAIEVPVTLDPVVFAGLVRQLEDSLKKQKVDVSVGFNGEQVKKVMQGLQKKLDSIPLTVQPTVSFKNLDTAIDGYKKTVTVGSQVADLDLGNITTIIDNYKKKVQVGVDSSKLETDLAATKNEVQEALGTAIGKILEATGVDISAAKKQIKSLAVSIKSFDANALATSLQQAGLVGEEAVESITQSVSNLKKETNEGIGLDVDIENALTDLAKVSGSLGDLNKTDTKLKVELKTDKLVTTAKAIARKVKSIENSPVNISAKVKLGKDAVEDVLRTTQLALDEAEKLSLNSQVIFTDPEKAGEAAEEVSKSLGIVQSALEATSKDVDEFIAKFNDIQSNLTEAKLPINLDLKKVTQSKARLASIKTELDSLYVTIQSNLSETGFVEDSSELKAKIDELKGEVITISSQISTDKDALTEQATAQVEAAQAVVNDKPVIVPVKLTDNTSKEIEEISSSIQDNIDNIARVFAEELPTSGLPQYLEDTSALLEKLKKDASVKLSISKDPQTLALLTEVETHLYTIRSLGRTALTINNEEALASLLQLDSAYQALDLRTSEIDFTVDVEVTNQEDLAQSEASLKTLGEALQDIKNIASTPISDEAVTAFTDLQEKIDKLDTTNKAKEVEELFASVEAVAADLQRIADNGVEFTTKIKENPNLITELNAKVDAIEEKAKKIELDLDLPEKSLESISGDLKVAVATLNAQAEKVNIQSNILDPDTTKVSEVVSKAKASIGDLTIDTKLKDVDPDQAQSVADNVTAKALIDTEAKPIENIAAIASEAAKDRQIELPTIAKDIEKTVLDAVSNEATAKADNVVFSSVVTGDVDQIAPIRLSNY